MARVLHSVQGVEERFVRGKRRHRGRREERVVREDVTGGNYEGTSHSSSVVSLLFLLSIRFFFFFRGNNFPLGTRHYSKFCATPLSRRRCLKSANAALSLLSLLLVVRDSPFLLLLHCLRRRRTTSTSKPKRDFGGSWISSKRR